MRHPIVSTVGASLALAGAVTVGTIHAAGADTAQAATLHAIHALVDQAVVEDMQANYGLPATSADCWTTTGGGTPWPAIACTIGGPNGWHAIGDGIAYLNPWVPLGVSVGMVYR